jgi:hypothetical protein
MLKRYEECYTNNNQHIWRNVAKTDILTGLLEHIWRNITMSDARTYMMKHYEEWYTNNNTTKSNNETNILPTVTQSATNVPQTNNTSTSGMIEE